MICQGTQFEVVPTNGLGGDIFTKNVMNGRMHIQTDRQTDRQTDDGQTLAQN